MANKTATVFSSNGTLVIDKLTGKVIHVHLDEGGEGIDQIFKFDLDEYKNYYNVTVIPDSIDILDLGYLDKMGVYEYPAQDWREETGRMRAGEDLVEDEPEQDVPEPPVEIPEQPTVTFLKRVLHSFNMIRNTRLQDGNGKFDTYSLAIETEQLIEAQQKQFPNGFDSWYETHHEVVEFITRKVMKMDAPGVAKNVVTNTKETQGQHGIYTLGLWWTNEFEKKYLNHDWGQSDIDFFEAIELFLNEKNKL